MKKSLLKFTGLLLAIALILSACDFPLGQNDGFDEEMAQTMVALAFTQTAVAEAAQAEGPEQVETEAPPEAEVPEETEAVAEETEAPTRSPTPSPRVNRAGSTNGSTILMPAKTPMPVTSPVGMISSPTCMNGRSPNPRWFIALT